MAKRQLDLTEQEIGQFRAAEAHTRDVHELKRLQAIRLYGSSVPLVTIQDMVARAKVPFDNGQWSTGIKG